MMKWDRVSVQVDGQDNLIVDGVTLPLSIIPELLHTLAHPDPRKWYRFERIDNAIIVHVKITEETPNGNAIGSIGSNEDSRQQGEEVVSP